jgi:hypothetical protein
VISNEAIGHSGRQAAARDDVLGPFRRRGEVVYWAAAPSSAGATMSSACTPNVNISRTLDPNQFAEALTPSSYSARRPNPPNSVAFH